MTSRFRFRLQPVLDHRQRILDERRRDLALKARELADAETVLANLVCERDAGRDELTRDHARFDGDLLRATYAHLAYVDRAIDDQTIRVAACDAEVVRAQAALLEANTDRKILETLKARRHEAFLVEAANVEQREVDDQNARRFCRAQTREEPQR